jgi:hypothetical protein
VAPPPTSIIQIMLATLVMAFLAVLYVLDCVFREYEKTRKDKKRREREEKKNAHGNQLEEIEPRPRRMAWYQAAEAVERAKHCAETWAESCHFYIRRERRGRSRGGGEQGRKEHTGEAVMEV